MGAQGDGATKAASAGKLQTFIQQLAQFLTSWQATTFLVGEYAQEEIRDNPLFTVADGVLWLSQLPERNSVVRKLQILKMRGQATVPGLQRTIRIGDDGVLAFSRTLGLGGKKINPLRGKRRLSMGIPELDKMMNGGVLEGDSLASSPDRQARGNRRWPPNSSPPDCAMGTPAVMVLFEERPEGLHRSRRQFWFEFKDPAENGKTGNPLLASARSFGG